MVTPDYVGSAEEWEDYVIDSLISRYKTGQGGAGGYASGGIGQPDPADFNNPSKPLSAQTQQYWENYVRKYGASDPWIVENFGPRPGRNATYVQDPNSASAIQGSWKDRSAWEAEQNEKDRAKDLAIAGMQHSAAMAQIAASKEIAALQEAGATQRTQMQIEASWREAMLADATRRYIAEGDWGVQKWVTTENNTAAMARLQMQLQFDREALAQQAIAEKNRHQEQMVALALEVAKYDADLAASPRNWLKYAAWLKERDIVVNGLSLAMAAQEVPDTAIDPGTVANSTGDNIGAIQTSQEALVSGQSGGAVSSQDAFGAGTQEMAAAGGQQPQTTAVTNQGLGDMRPTISAQQLSGTTDYAALARQLLGMNPMAASGEEASTANLQSIQDSLRTSKPGRVASFGAYGGPTTNALGVQVSEVSGGDVDYRKFSKLLPSQQEAKVGAIESVRGPYGVSDWVKEMEMSRPKGDTSSLAWG